MLLLAKVCVHENCQTRTLPAVVGQVSLRLTWLLDLVVKKKKNSNNEWTATPNSPYLTYLILTLL